MLGVVVLKVDFRELEADWRQSNAPIFVTDEHGVVLLGSLPQWRFDVLAPLSEELAQRLRTSLQFGDARFQSVPISPPLQTSSAGTLVRGRCRRSGRLAAAAHHAAHHRIAGWTLHLLSPVQSALNRASANAQLGALLAQSLLAAIVGVLLYRRHRGHEHTRQQTAIRQQLADQVHERTAQLRLANDRLLGEMDERQRAQARLHTLQDDWSRPASWPCWDRWPPASRTKSTSLSPPSAATRTMPPNSCAARIRRPRAKPGIHRLAHGTHRPYHRRAARLRARPARRSRRSAWARRWTALLLAGRAAQGVALHRPAAGQDARVLADRIRRRCWSRCAAGAGRSAAAASPWPCATRASGCSSISMTTDRA